MILKNKIQKPIDNDIHLKYRCPKCGQDHWLSYKEASTKNFKTVCYCGNVFKVKRIAGFKLKFHKPEIKTKTNTTDVSDTVQKSISEELLTKAITTLTNYGFTKSEASDIIKKSYEKNQVDDLTILVKQTLESLRN
ncbi:hypothetical protein EB118_10355 [bacterium]|nr:hypothetical protein [bacterium]NDC95122.1 hypothetical protein [bacterium]NDD85395.1 hypothetical protein [bacterium]NDG30458.1 hypothetical protein [bacterium]